MIHLNFKYIGCADVPNVVVNKLVMFNLTTNVGLTSLTTVVGLILFVVFPYGAVIFAKN